ncbi:hypothetical protein O181_022688 [Austropuccinia psidii MF-1]|uniref:CCHC-type domain-containing protein n=1 Tax=Austropuccinia psidii MF-1 TaxID=1389203 RepID=A0A9Q3CFN4_9BASI|nr:hypothetical protein [Austropuccinia psidii MF-1]
MSFENDKYSNTYEWCIRQYRRLNAIDPQMNIQMRNSKLLTQIPGEPEHEMKCRYNQSCTLYDISNTLQDVKKRTNIEKPKEGQEDVTKKKKTSHNCGSTDHYASNCPKATKKVASIEQVPEEESSIENSESDSRGDSITETSDSEQDPREEFLVEYQEETQLEIQDIQLEAGIAKDTKKNLCEHTQDAQNVLVTPTRGMTFIHGTATKMTICIDKAQHSFIIDSGAH